MGETVTVHASPELFEKIDRVHEHIRLHPFPGADCRDAYEIAYLLAALECGYADDQDVLEGRHWVPI